MDYIMTVRTCQKMNTYCKTHFSKFDFLLYDNLFSIMALFFIAPCQAPSPRRVRHRWGYTKEKRSYLLLEKRGGGGGA